MMTLSGRCEPVQLKLEVSSLRRNGCPAWTGITVQFAQEWVSSLGRCAHRWNSSAIGACNGFNSRNTRIKYGHLDFAIIALEVVPRVIEIIRETINCFLIWIVRTPVAEYFPHPHFPAHLRFLIIAQFVRSLGDCPNEVRKIPVIVGILLHL